MSSGSQKNNINIHYYSGFSKTDFPHKGPTKLSMKTCLEIKSIPPFHDQTLNYGLANDSFLRIGGDDQIKYNFFLTVITTEKDELMLACTIIPYCWIAD